MLMVFKTFVKPATTFAETVAPPAPDYSNLEHWAALPDREDALELAYTDIEAAFEDNEGALSIVSNSLMPGAADGACENGMLYVSEIRTDAYDKLPNMGKGNHHLLDYALYWSNIRRNVAERVAAFVE